MADRVVNRPDVFPVGTSVVAVPSAFISHLRQRADAAPVISGSEAQTVQADGSLTFTTLAAGIAYTLYATVNSAYRFLRISNTTYAAPGRLPHPWIPAT